MNTKNQNIDFLKTDSHNFQESNTKVDINSSSVSSALVIANHKESYCYEYSEVPLWYGKHDNPHHAEATSPSHQSQREIRGEENSHREQAGLGCPLPKRYNTAPRLKGGEINRLAKVWCELLLSQIQEVDNQYGAFGHNPVENKYREFTY